VNLFNSNLVFRYFVLTNKKAISLIQDDFATLTYIETLLSFGRRVTLPEPVTPVDEKFVEKLEETYKLFHDQALKEASKTEDKFECNTETSHNNELYKEAVHCLQTKLADTNQRWRSFETIIDHIRSKFNAPKRTCSKLFNPVARWM